MSQHAQADDDRQHLVDPREASIPSRGPLAHSFCTKAALDTALLLLALCLVLAGVVRLTQVKPITPGVRQHVLPPSAEQAPNGEEICEGHGLNEEECRGKACCEFDDGHCWSAVGDGPCSRPREGPIEAPGHCSGALERIRVSPLPDELNAYREFFDKYVSVFGIPIIAEEGVPDWKVEHAGNVMAQYLDYDEDGEVNNKDVLRSIHIRRGLILMFTEPGSDMMEAVWEADLSGQDLNKPDIPPHAVSQYKKRGKGGKRRLRGVANLTRSQRRPHRARAVFERLPKCLDSEVRHHTGSPRDCEESGRRGKVDPQFGRMDASLEEVLHMLWAEGYSRVYPDAFGLRDSELSRAMDKQIADCGHAYDGTFKFPRCTGNYHYADESCGYYCLVIEYQYWTLTSILGAQDGTARWATGSRGGQCEDVEEEWELCSKGAVRSKDPDVYRLYDLDGENKYKVPDRLPRGKYNPSPRPSRCSMALSPEYHSYYHARVSAARGR